MLIAAKLEAFQELFSTDTCATVDAQFELTYFLVDFLHEMNHKVNQFVLIHLLGMEICDKE